MSVFLKHVPDEVAPQLNLWVDIRHASPERRAYLIERLTAIIDSLFTTYHGVQAYLALWKDAPLGQDSTPYELVCGIHGYVTMHHAWCTQFLRSVSERMWIGPALLARLPMPDALADHAAVAPVGDGVRVTVASPTHLDALEQILAPILPSEGDWRQAVDALDAEIQAQRCP